MNHLRRLCVCATLVFFAAVTAHSTQAATTRIMLMGDSITQGQGVAGGYRERLEALLNKAAIPFDFVGTATSVWKGETTLVDREHEGYPGFVINGGQDGLGTGGASGLHDALVLRKSLEKAGELDIACVMIGTNDFNKKVQDISSTPNERLNNLIRYLHAKKPKLKIIVATIIPLRDRLPENEKVEAFNAALLDPVKGVRQFPNVTVIDVNAAFKNKDHSVNADLYPKYDKVHPNKAGYDVIADGFFAGIQAALKAPKSAVKK
jgi:lysophospholipase L1-like esterase